MTSIDGSLGDCWPFSILVYCPTTTSCCGDLGLQAFFGSAELSKSHFKRCFFPIEGSKVFIFFCEPATQGGSDVGLPTGSSAMTNQR